MKVGPYTWTVHFSPEAENGGVGHTDFKTQVISVAEDQHPQQERDTVLHEVLHVAMFLAGMNGHELEESLIQRLTPVLLMVLKDNPNFAGYLAEPF